ncbi:hypothetical protein CMUST_09640 [Corynebacterium mustelae]|uniref:Uncharacterized protein n=2 Tax=Corynebacterium mustelae TaxID=571915 RepID=A0A0G3GYK9_9CORY|nr:hypothetical protein CMUST_09640 [Corynebacterium mustelae]
MFRCSDIIVPMTLLDGLVGKNLDGVTTEGYLIENSIIFTYVTLWLRCSDKTICRLDWGYGDIGYSLVDEIDLEWDGESDRPYPAELYAIDLGVVEKVEVNDRNSMVKIHTNFGVLTIDAWCVDGFHHYFVPNGPLMHLPPGK